MIQKELIESMNLLLSELNKSDDVNNKKTVIAKAVQLGMKYQEQKIKTGIDIVFNSLHEQK